MFFSTLSFSSTFFVRWMRTFMDEPQIDFVYERAGSRAAAPSMKETTGIENVGEMCALGLIVAPNPGTNPGERNCISYSRV